MRDKKATLVEQVTKARQSRGKTRRSPSPARVLATAVSPVKVQHDANIFQKDKFAKALSRIGSTSPAKRGKSARAKSPSRLPSRTIYKPTDYDGATSDSEDDNHGDDDPFAFPDDDDDDDDNNVDDNKKPSSGSGLFKMPRNSYLSRLGGGASAAATTTATPTTPLRGRVSLASLRPSWLTPSSEPRVGRSPSRALFTPLTIFHWIFSLSMFYHYLHYVVYFFFSC
jgi:hypothetical protein